ncbi:non-hydrolyzing UDP-N-acetylglucosamine 2-epimerase [Candidatus Margulisiibacteriota bacterium]
MSVSKKKIALVFGTRPEAIKMAPVWLELLKNRKYFKPQIVVTGQHKEMLDQVLKRFKIKADQDLKVMLKDQSLMQLSNRLFGKLEKSLSKLAPDLVLVQGDTTSTFLASLVAFTLGIPVGHIEAGLRTGDAADPYPEEMNRTLTTNLAGLHFAPTEQAYKIVKKEKKGAKHLYLTGNTVIDALRKVLSKNGHKQVKSKQRPYILVTAHRRESFGGPLQNICVALKALAKKNPQFDLVYPVHLNPNVQKTARDFLKGINNVKLIPPLEYLEFSRLMKGAYLILTDSGGIQEEAPVIGVPVLVLREKTERPEAIESGAVKLIGTNSKRIISETQKLLDNQKYYKQMAEAISPYGDGKAAQRIVQALKYYFGFSNKKPRAFRPKKVKIR